MKFRFFILLLLMVACACAGDRRNRVRHDGFTKAWEGLALASVSYGFTEDRLHFVVFESGHREIIPHAKLSMVTQPEGYNLCWGHIELPDGTKPDLPSSGRIYEFTSGKFASAPIDFTRSQLKAYLDTDPRPPTIDGLRRHISKQP